MTLPTVPLVDGAFYWVKSKDGGGWMAAQYDKHYAFFDCPAGFFDREDLAAISGPIPTPDEGGE